MYLYECVCFNNWFLPVNENRLLPSLRINDLDSIFKFFFIFYLHGIIDRFITVADLKEKLVNTVHIFLSCLMNLMSDIFMANHKPKAGFYLYMTFKPCMAPGARKFEFSCGVMERAKI